MASTKVYEKENNVSKQLSNLMISGIAGSLIGASAALLLAPKSGKKLRRDISNTYCDLTDKTQDLADNIKESTSHFITHPETNSNLIIGAVGGAFLGATLLFLLTREGEKNDCLNSWKDKIKESGQSVVNNLNTFDWVETAKDVVNDITEKLQKQSGNVKKQAENTKENMVNTLLDWANLGLHVWQNVNKRR